MKECSHKVIVSPITAWAEDFPIDMLRHDGLWPFFQADSERIISCLRGHETGNRSVKIALVRRAPEDWIPARVRWNSFLWKVVKHEVH